jgi:hypothetical protein
LQHTPVENVRAVVEMVHEHSSQKPDSINTGDRGKG